MSSEPEVKKAVWSCEFCSRDFVIEKAFMSHRCKERERIDILRSPVGAAAYVYYCEWLKNKKRSIQTIETFGASSMFSTFIKFATHADKTNIPNIPQFIKLMVANNDVSPSLWCRDNVYALYLEWYDQAYPPEIQVIESLDFAKTLIEDFKCEPANLFSTIPIDTLVLYIKKKKLAPWFLVSSKTFRTFLITCDSESKDKIERSMNMGGMIARIQKDQGLFEFFNRVTSSENL